MSIHTGAQHIHHALDAWLASNNTLLIGESVGRGEGLGGSTRGLQATHGTKVLDTPVGDRSIVGLGLGLALAGTSVCVELSSTRSLLAAAGILTDASRMASTEFRPSLTIRVPYEQGLGPQLEPPVSDLLCKLAGVQVHITRTETVSSLLSAALKGGVHVILEPVADYMRPAPAGEAQLGKAQMVHPGDHLTIVAWGAGLSAALDAAERVANEGITVEIIDPITLSTIDPTIGEHVQKTGRILVVHSEDSSFSDRVLAHALRSAFLYLESPPSDCHAVPEAVVKAIRDSVHY